MKSAQNNLFSGLEPIDPKTGVPLYRQVEASLRILASRPVFQNGALLPDEITIANRLGVSRGTVRAALMRLVNEGLVERKAGAGTRVIRPQVESAVYAWRSFTREMAAKGVVVQTFRTETTKTRVSSAVAQGLEIKPGTIVTRLDRLRGWNDVPVLFCRSWFHPRLQLRNKLDLSKPLYESIESETGIVADKAREELTAVLADEMLAAQLQIAVGEALLCRSHIVSDKRGRPFEYAILHYVSTRFTLTMNLQQESP